MKHPAATLRAIDAAGAAIALVLAGALYLFLLQPLVVTYNQFLDESAKVSTRKNAAASAAVALKAAKLQLEGLQDQVASSPLRLQPARLINGRLAELTDLATRTGLRIEDVQPGKTVTLPRFETVPIRFAGTGSYRNCVLFLNRLRKNYPDTSVSSFKLTGNPSAPETLAKFTFDVEWFCSLPETATTR
jgi:Tfp pilus assembly protein PilO